MFNVMSLTCELNGHGSWPFTAKFISPMRRVSASISAYLPAEVAADGLRVAADGLRVAADGLRVIVDLAALEDVDSSGLRVLVRGLKCAGGSDDQRQYRRTCTRSGTATAIPAVGPPRWHDLTPPTRTIVPACFCLNRHNEKSLRPAGHRTRSLVPGYRVHRGHAAIPADRRSTAFLSRPPPRPPF